MKYLLILLLSIPALASTPKYCLRDKVHYPVSHFYSKVCNGHGTVVDYDGEKNKYLIESRDYQIYCPTFWVHESDLTLEK